MINEASFVISNLYRAMDMNKTPVVSISKIKHNKYVKSITDWSECFPVKRFLTLASLLMEV